MRRTVRAGIALRAGAAVVLGVLIGTTAACGSGGDEPAGPVTIRFDWWGNPDRAKATEAAVARFEKKHPEIKVETSYAEFNAYFQKLVTQIAGGGAPDVLQMDYRYVREYADRNQLARLDSGPAEVDTSGTAGQLLSGGSVGGRLFGIPPTQNTQSFIYDPAQWAKSGAAAPKDGWTWTDLAAAAQKVSDSTGKKVSGVSDFGGIEDWFEVWLHQQGKTLYTADGKLGYTDSDVAAWWKLADGLRRSGAATPAEVTAKLDGSQANDPVTQKTASAGFGYDSGFTPQSWEIMGREMKLAPFPSDTGRTGQYAKPAMLFSVAQRSAHKEQAAELISFLLHDPDAGQALGMSRGLPADEQVQAAVGGALTGPPKDAFDFEQRLKATLEQAPPPPPKGAGTVKSAFQRVYDDVIFQRTSVDAAAAKFLDQAQQALVP